MGERGGAALVRVPAGSSSGLAVETDVAGDGLEQFIPEPLRRHLQLEVGEGEHRTVTVAFVKFSGVDGLLAAEGAEAVFWELELLGRSVADSAAELGVTWLESDVDVDGGTLYLVAGAPTRAARTRSGCCGRSWRSSTRRRA